MSTASDVQAVLRQLDTEIAEAEQHLDDLRVQRRGAEALLARLPASTARTRTPSTRQRAGGNAEIVAAILATNPEGMDLQDIENATSERGTPLDNEQVRSAVTYLRRRGDAERVGRGVWRSLTPINAESPEASGLSVLPTPLQEGVAATG
jgi:hypothetical protein